MNDHAKHSRLTTASTGSPIEEAYRRVAQLHYALSTADSLSDSLHLRAIDDLMDVLEILETSMPPRRDSRAEHSSEQ